MPSSQIAPASTGHDGHGDGPGTAVTGEPLSAKDFRTWAGTLLAVHALGASEPCRSMAAGKRQVRRVLEQVSAVLGNTVAICRKSYVHPAVIDQFACGKLHTAIDRAVARARQRPVRGLRHSELVALHWLKALPSRPPSEQAVRAKAA